MFLAHGNKISLIDKGNTYTYKDLEQEKNKWLRHIEEKKITSGKIIALQSDFSFSSICLLFALFENKNIVALISPTILDPTHLLTSCRAEYLFSQTQDETWEQKRIEPEQKRHSLIVQLNQEEKAGFIIFTSGTSGKPKAVLHDLEKFQSSLKNANKAFRTLTFLLLDHIAGIDTLFYTFKSGGSLVSTNSRSPNTVCELIEKHQVEVLPVSPSFINLLFISRDFLNFNLSSLKIVTLGSEPVSAGLLERAKTIFPEAKIIQKYGTSEFGSPRTKTRPDDPTWLLMESEFFKIKVIDGVLWVKSETTMLGYLNQAEQPVDGDWYCTGDRVETDGEWIRILGRDSDIINVGGEKVFPTEVEAVILELSHIEECLVYGEENPLLGNIVCAKVKVCNDSSKAETTKEIRKYCLSKLERYKVPVKIEISLQNLVTERQKKIRSKNS